MHLYTTPNLQSATPIQMVRPNEGGQNRTENRILLLNYDDFHVKYNIISGTQRTVQNKKQRQFMTPLMFTDWHWTWNIPLSHFKIHANIIISAWHDSIFLQGTWEI